MRGLRGGAVSGVVVCGALIALGASNCASATVIELDIRAERLCDRIKSTGIVVTTPDRVDTDDLELFETGCEQSRPDRVGTLTITPSGEKDATVGIRIVAGVTKPAHECTPPLYDGCVLARRRVRFVPGHKVPITVILSDRCLSRDCGDLECDPNTGTCIPPQQILNDGGVVEPAEDGGGDSDGDAPFDASADAGDACASCSGTGMTCDSATRRCTIDCSEANCINKTLCGEGLDCVVGCPAAGLCVGTRCASRAGTCTFNCLGGTGASERIHCSNISCSSKACNVTCQDTLHACKGVYLDGGTNDVKCTSADKIVCEDVHCSGGPGAGACKRTCGAGGVACGPTASCEPVAGCGGWEDGGVPDGG